MMQNVWGNKAAFADTYCDVAFSALTTVQMLLDLGQAPTFRWLPLVRADLLLVC